MSSSSDTKPACCEICNADCALTFHHLIPRTCHSNKWFRKRFAREEMLTSGLYLCRQCHGFLHERFTEKHLGRELNTREKLFADEQVTKYRRWARRRVG